MSKIPKIICFGGGNGMPKLVLEPLKELGVELVSVTSMIDNGGSTGALRKEFNILPPGDIRRHLLALSEAEEWKKKLWNFRFGKDIEYSPRHFGHNFANVFVGGLEYLLGDFEKALEISHQFLSVKGKCFPATLDKLELVAELEDGTVAEGEDEIDLGENHNRNLRIEKVYLKPGGRIYSKLAEELKSADFVIIGPGDFYSSLVPCFLPKGAKEAVSKSPAKKIFISPAINKLGETQDFSIKKFSEEIERYIGTSLDVVIYNSIIPEKERILEFKKTAEFALDLPKIDEGLDRDKFKGEKLLLSEGEIKYDKEKLIPVLRKIINI